MADTRLANCVDLSVHFLQKLIESAGKYIPSFDMLGQFSELTLHLAKSETFQSNKRLIASGPTVYLPW